jgi:hypothetical protein
MTTATQAFDLAEVQDALNEAGIQARTAAKAMYAKYGDWGSCGFAHVSVFGVRSNSKLGKALQSAGFRRSYDGGLKLHNPSQMAVQSVAILEAGAEAYAQVLSDRLEIRAYAGSRLD